MHDEPPSQHPDDERRMKLVIEGAGEFLPYDGEREMLEQLRAQRPDFTPRELVTAIYLGRCIHFAFESREGATPVTSVHARDALRVAPAAALNVFGEAWPTWLRALELDSSAKVGAAVFRMVAAGVLTADDSDRLDDFHVHSELDDALQSPVVVPAELGAEPASMSTTPSTPDPETRAKYRRLTFVLLALLALAIGIAPLGLAAFFIPFPI